MPIDLNPPVQAGEDRLDVGEAADDGGFPGDDRGAAAGVLRDQPGGQVAGPDILLQGALDLLRKVAGKRYRRHGGCLGRENTGRFGK